MLGLLDLSSFLVNFKNISIPSSEYSRFLFCPGSNSNSLSELPAFDTFVYGQMPFLADYLSNFLFLASLINILSSKFEPAMTTLLL